MIYSPTHIRNRIMSIDAEQLAQESAIWPWLDSDCMSDPATEEDFFSPLDFESGGEEDED